MGVKIELLGQIGMLFAPNGSLSGHVLLQVNDNTIPSKMSWPDSILYMVFRF
jgi:hypothetical protein